MGPSGRATCDPQPDQRAPDRQAFQTLRPGGNTNVTSRLIELCPKGTFSEPGLYLIHGRFDARETGETLGMDAWVGQISSKEPALVRIRTGEQHGLERQMLRSNLAGQSGAASDRAGTGQSGAASDRAGTGQSGAASDHATDRRRASDAGVEPAR
jgi:hypothetical protein